MAKMDLNFKLTQLNTFITAGAIFSAFTLAIFIEFDETTVPLGLQRAYYLITTFSFIFSTASVLIAVGIMRTIGVPDITNEDSQELLRYIKKKEYRVFILEMLFFFLGAECFLLQFALLAFARIADELMKWVISALVVGMAILGLAYAIYVWKRGNQYAKISAGQQELPSISFGN